MGGEKGGFVAMVGNFSVQYNLTSASIALMVMATAPNVPEKPDWASYLLLSVVFAGAATGMLVMGRLGDIIGRARAMQITTGLTVVGAVLPACAWGPASVWYGLIISGRFTLGVGVGGVYPLSAAASAEAGSADPVSRAQRVATAFLFQAPGVMAPYGCALLLGNTLDKMVLFRTLFLLGAVPAMVGFVASCGLTDSEEFTAACENRKDTSLRETLASQPFWMKKTLAGTCLTWFFFDVVFYGTIIFVPSIVKSIFGDDESLQSTTQHSLMIAAISLPGALLSWVTLPCLGARLLNIVGFVCQAFIFFVFAAAYFLEQPEMVKFVIMCVLQFSLCFGPNFGTYVAPVVCFPAEVRSTFHGLSAMWGKLGAVLGAAIFVPMHEAGGVVSVLCFQLVAALLGALAAYLLMLPDSEYSVAPSDAPDENGFSPSVATTPLSSRRELSRTELSEASSVSSHSDGSEESGFCGRC